MNEILKTISTRRSIRNFKPEQLKREDVDSIIQAGLYAPSANNTQNWHFTVVQNRAMIEKVNKWILDEKYDLYLNSEKNLDILNSIDPELHKFYTEKVLKNKNKFYNIYRIKLFLFLKWYERWI